MPGARIAGSRKSITDGRYRASGERQLWGQTYPFRGEGAKSGFGATSPLTTALAKARITLLLSHTTFAIGTALDAPFAGRHLDRNRPVRRVSGSPQAVFPAIVGSWPDLRATKFNRALIVLAASGTATNRHGHPERRLENGAGWGPAPRPLAFATRPASAAPSAIPTC
jgi:hypothetical protein